MTDISITERNLQSTDSPHNCVACLEPTNTIANCCRVAICNTCYLRWLSMKRECMHCHADQCEFEEWVNNYRIETDDIPENFFTTQQFNNPFQFLNVIDSTMNNAAALQNLTFSILPPPSIPDEPFDLEYGFIVEQPGAEPITVSHTIPGDVATHDYIEHLLSSFTALARENTDNINSDQV